MKSTKSRSSKKKPVSRSKSSGKDSPRKSAFRKFVWWTVGSVLLIGILFVSFLMYTEKMLIRLPVLVQEDPTITFTLGKVEYSVCADCEPQEWLEAKSGVRLHKGSVLKTGRKAVADIRFHDTFAIRVMPESRFVIDYSTINKVRMMLEQGALYGKFEKLFKSHRIEVKTPTAIAGVRGTELGFKVDRVKAKNNAGKRNVAQDADDAYTPVTTVYALSGITEVYNPKFENEKILLSYQNKVLVPANSPPEDPLPIPKRETRRIRSILNAIHTEEVLLISNKIHFEVGSARLLSTSYPELDKVADMLQKESFVIRIEGHADSQSSAGLNYVLSVRRARAIREYLHEKGIPYKRMAVAGYGESKPVASNKTEKGRALNRRVEFIIIR